MTYPNFLATFFIYCSLRHIKHPKINLFLKINTKIFGYIRTYSYIVINKERKTLL